MNANSFKISVNIQKKGVLTARQTKSAALGIAIRKGLPYYK